MLEHGVMHPASSPEVPCIVWGLETQIGLSVARELGRAGVPVIGIAYTANAIGLRSQYVTTGIVAEDQRTESFAASIREIGDRWGPCPLIAISETNLQWLASNRDALGVVRPVLPPNQALAQVLDKHATLTAAGSLGIEVPMSREPAAGSNFESLVADGAFPVVLKWKDPNRVAPLLHRHGLNVLKAEYVYSAKDLLAALHRYDEVGQWPLVQEYCPGYGLGQFFFMREGQVLRRFQHRRIAEWPPEGGFSSVCDVVPINEHLALQQKSVELLRSIGWEGVAMVEYRFDPARSRAVLMEINGRFWGSYPLALYAHAEFALLSYRAACGLPLEPLPRVSQRLRCRMVATELKRLVRIVAQRRKIADRAFAVRPVAEVGRFVADFFRPGVRYYVWSWRDPGPFIADVRNLVRSFWAFMVRVVGARGNRAD